MRTELDHLNNLREQLSESLSINMRGAFDIFKHYGSVRQLEKLAEEARELEMAAMVSAADIVRDNFFERSHIDNLVEEMADVCVMIYQITRWLGAENAVREIAAQKIARTLNRIAEKEAVLND